VMKFLKGQFPEDVAEEGRSNAKGFFHLANRGLCRKRCYCENSMIAVPSGHASLSCRHPGQTFEYVERRTWFLDAASIL